MKIRKGILDHLHVDSVYCLMTAQHVKLLHEIFKVLDIHDKDELNDVQFLQYMMHVTDLGKSNIYKVFDMLDVDGSGKIDFDEFYMLNCILVAIKDKQEKKFIYCHSRAVFQLLDADGNKSISAKEFQQFGFLFNYTGLAVRKIFREFDVSGDQELDYSEFRMFAMACIDAQQEIVATKKQQLQEKIAKAQQGNLWSRAQLAAGALTTAVIPSAYVLSTVDIKLKDEIIEEPADLEEQLKEVKKTRNPWQSLVDLYTADESEEKGYRPVLFHDRYCVIQ